MTHAEIELIERLDAAIDAILAGDFRPDVAEPELADAGARRVRSGAVCQTRSSNDNSKGGFCQ